MASSNTTRAKSQAIIKFREECLVVIDLKPVFFILQLGRLWSHSEWFTFNDKNNHDKWMTSVVFCPH